MSRPTRGSRRMFLSLTRPLAVLITIFWPSNSNQTGATCGLPSGIKVANCAKAFFWSKSWYFSGIVAIFLLSGFFERTPSAAQSVQGIFAKLRHDRSLTVAARNRQSAFTVAYRAANRDQLPLG